MVDAGGSQLIVGARVTNCASDRNELVADIAAIPAVLGRPATVLADNGYANGDEVAALAESDIEALVATGSSGRRRRYDFRPAKTEVPVKKPKAEWLKVMAAKLERCAVPAAPVTVEPVFGIIKAALGFTGFSLRGLDKVAGEVGSWWRCPTTASACTSSSWRGHAVGPQDRCESSTTAQQPENRPAIDPSEPILAVPNFDRATDITQHRADTLLAAAPGCRRAQRSGVLSRRCGTAPSELDRDRVSSDPVGAGTCCIRSGNHACWR